MSLALRAGVPPEAIIDQSMSIRPCNAYVNRTKSKHDTSMGTSCPSAIGYALKDLYDKMADRNMIDVSNEEDDEEAVININEKQTSAKCPECGASLLFEGGCVCCKNCGWSKCD